MQPLWGTDAECVKRSHLRRWKAYNTVWLPWPDLADACTWLCLGEGQEAAGSARTGRWKWHCGFYSSLAAIGKTVFLLKRNAGQNWLACQGSSQAKDLRFGACVSASWENWSVNQESGWISGRTSFLYAGWKRKSLQFSEHANEYEFVSDPLNLIQGSW